MIAGAPATSSWLQEYSRSLCGLPPSSWAPGKWEAETSPVIHLPPSCDFLPVPCRSRLIIRLWMAGILIIGLRLCYLEKIGAHGILLSSRRKIVFFLISKRMPGKGAESHLGVLN